MPTRIAFASALSSSGKRRLVASLLAGLVLAGLPYLHGNDASPARIWARPTASGSWLDRLNQWRVLAGLSQLTENTLWSSGDYNHSVYMVKNDLVTHYETPGVPYYTIEGDTAARNGNIEVNSSTSFSDQQAIDWWMQAPFHAMNMMDPRLTQTGFGSYREVKSGWQAGFTLDTIRGNSFTGGTYPVFWPGNRVSEPMTTYGGGEFPDPLQACSGYSAPTGLPVFIEIGGNVNTTAGAVHSFTGGGVSLEHCVIDSTNAALSSYLYTRGGVIVVPKQPLQTGVRYVVALTVNGLPYTWSFTVGPLPPVVPVWQSLGGTLTSGPDASSWGPSRTDVFVRGSDNGLWYQTWNGTSWSGFAPLGGVLTSDPGVVSWGPDRIDVFVRGADNALYHKFWYGAWSNWEWLGGVLTTGPDVASWSRGRLDVFVRGSDNALWHRFWDVGGWSNWESLGGTLASDPTAVSWGPNRIDVFAQAADNTLMHKWWNGVRWNGWESLGGILTSAPDATSCASGHLDVFVIGLGATPYRIGFNGAAWGAWQPVGGTWSSEPGAVCPPGTSTINLYERGTDNALWQTTLIGS